MGGSALVPARNSSSCVSRWPIVCSLAQRSSMLGSCVYSRRPLARNEWKKELLTDPSTTCRNSLRGMSTACTLTPSALSEIPAFSTLRSSIVTSTRSMSDFAQTVSCERLPQRTTARIARSFLISSTSASSAAVNVWWIEFLCMRAIVRSILRSEGATIEGAKVQSEGATVRSEVPRVHRTIRPSHRTIAPGPSDLRTDLAPPHPRPPDRDYL